VVRDAIENNQQGYVQGEHGFQLHRRDWLVFGQFVNSVPFSSPDVLLHCFIQPPSPKPNPNK